MFDLPERYHADSPIAAKNLITRDMKKSDKDKLRDSLVSMRLAWQIAGEDVPSRIDESHNCAVIMGFDAVIGNIKDAAFMAELLQPLFKALCVIRFTDKIGSSVTLAFAAKRLNLNDDTQIVVTDKVLTAPASVTLPDKPAALLREHLAFGALRNKTDKLCLYTEAMVKAYLTANLRLYSGLEALLGSKLWYNHEKTAALFEKLKELSRLNAELAREPLPGEKAKLISKIKTLQASLSED